MCARLERHNANLVFASRGQDSIRFSETKRATLLHEVGASDLGVGGTETRSNESLKIFSLVMEKNKESTKLTQG